MKRSFLLFCTSSLALLLVSCSSTTIPSSTQYASNMIHRQKVVKTTKEKYPPKKSQSVTFFNKEIPQKAYRIIGVATVSKYNLFGIPREEAMLNDMMKDLAASIGGDGLMNISQNGDSLQANVIAYEKILI